jgi:hypothetical protein
MKEVRMDFATKELKVLLQALYRQRGYAAGASQAERNTLAGLQKIIDKIESEIGPLKPARTVFDREMDKSLSSLKKVGKAAGSKRRKP